MRHAPALASRKPSHLSKLSQPSHQDSKLLNQDLMATKDGRINLRPVQKKDSKGSLKGQISFLYSASSERSSKGQINREISTKLNIISRDISPNVNRSPHPNSTQKIKIDEQGPSSEPRLQSMLAAMIPEQPGDDSATLRKEPWSRNRAKLDQPQQTTSYQESNNTVYQQTATGPLINIRLGDNKKSVQHDAGYSQQTFQKNEELMRQQSQNLQGAAISSGQGGVTTLANPASMRTNPSLFPGSNQSPKMSATQAQFLLSPTHQQIAATKVQEKLMQSQNSFSAGSAKALQKASKIQRIQIMNKPGARQNNNCIESVQDMENIYKALKNNASTEQTKITALVGGLSNDDVKNKSLSQGKNSTPHSSNVSPMGATVSSYLHFQRFSRDGKQVLKQISTSPHNIAVTNMSPAPHKKSPSMKNQNSISKKSTGASPKATNKQSKRSSIINAQASPGQKQGDKSQSRDNSPAYFGNTVQNYQQLIMPLEDQLMLEVASKQLSPRKVVSNEKKDNLLITEHASQLSVHKEQQQSANKLSNLMGQGRSSFFAEQSNNRSKQFNQNELSFQELRDRSNRRSKKRTLASFLDSQQYQDNKDSILSRPTNMRDFASQPRTSKAATQRKLPQLQFVVKYAKRSRHESTVRYKDMDLQGSKTHIMPINLCSQNSLYFIEDQNFKKAYALKHQEQSRMVSNPSSPSNRSDSFNEPSLDEKDLAMESVHKSAKDFVQIITANSSVYQLQKTMMSNQNKLKQVTTEQLLPQGPDSSSLAWLRRQRRTVGYVRSFINRPRQPSKKNEKMAQTQKIQEDPDNVVNGWQGLSYRQAMGKPLLNELASATKKESNIEQTATYISGHQESEEDQSRMNLNIGASSGPHSRGQISSAGNDQLSYILRPKMLPSVKSGTGKREPGMAFTSGDFHKANNSVGQNQAGRDINSYQTKEKQFAQDLPSKKSPFNVHNPPRTSQLERRSRGMTQSPDDKDNNNDAFLRNTTNDWNKKKDDQLAKTDELNTTAEKLSSQVKVKKHVILNQSSFPGSFGFASQITQGERQDEKNNKVAKRNQRVLSYSKASIKEQQSSDLVPSVFRIEAPGRRPSHNAHALMKSPQGKGQGQLPISIMTSNSRSKRTPFYDSQFSFEKLTTQKGRNNQTSPNQTQKHIVSRKSTKKIVNQRVPLLHNDFSQEDMSESCQYSKAVLGQHHPSIHSDNSKPTFVNQQMIVNQQSSQIGQIGQIHGLNQYFGMNPKSKQSMLVRSRLQKLIQSGQSPFREANQNETDNCASGNNLSTRMIGRNSLGSTGKPNEVLIHNCSNDTQQLFSAPRDVFLETGAGRLIKDHQMRQILRGDSSEDDHQISPNKKDSYAQYKGVQIMRNGKVSPRTGIEGSQAMGEATVNGQVLEVIESKEASKVASRADLVNRVTTQPLSADLLVQINDIVEEEDSKQDQQPEGQEQKLVVQMTNSKLLKHQVKEVASLEKLSQVDEKNQSPTHIDESKLDSHNINQKSALSDEKNSNSQHETQMKMTQATPSQFELADLPSLHEFSQLQINSDPCNSGSGESSDAQHRIVGPPSQLMKVPVLPLKSAQVSWRLNNDSINDRPQQQPKYNDNVQVQQNEAGQDSLDSPRMKPNQQQRLSENNRIKAKVRPGINQILPKELVQELVESQGRRQMQKWLKVYEKSRDKTDNNISPTHEYLERKFNTGKREREVKFFKQANQMQFTMNSPQAHLLVQQAQSSEYSVPNYEKAGKNFKIDGVNVLTGATKRPQRLR